MAVYTQVSDEALEDFLEFYSVGSVVSFKGIAEGVENSNFLLRTSQASFILTLYEKRVEERDLPFFLGLMDHVAQKGVTCPLPIPAKDGALYRPLNGRPAALISFLDGISITHPTVDSCFALGKTLAEFHTAANDFALSRPNGLGPKAWGALFELCRSRASEINADLTELVSSELGDFTSHWPKGLPSGVIHADLFPDNVFFLNNELSGIIDFYFACNDLLAYDVAISINAWCFDDNGTFDKAKSAALLKGYQSVRDLRKEERDALPILCRGASVRFLLTRLHDWLFHPEGALVAPKDPRDYIKRLTFHKKTSGFSDYTD
jgi:homoserine kinase type II